MHSAEDNEVTQLKSAIASANIPALLMVLYQMTGEGRWLEDPYLPRRESGLGDNDAGGLREDIQQEIRDAAFEAISSWFGGAPLAQPLPSPETLARMLEISVAEPVPKEYGPMLHSELSMSNVLGDVKDTDGVLEATSSARRNTKVEGLHVAIVGAGISGIGAAMLLQRMGIEFTILERSTSLGGTWRENRYPGAGVDTPSHLYSYVSEPHDWEHFFALQGEIHNYLETVARKHDLHRHIRFGTTVESLQFDEATKSWTVTYRDDDGMPASLDTGIVFSAVGAFNTPKIPNFPGIDTFEGQVLHTGDWPDHVDLKDREVAVIGTGASAMQAAPMIAGETRHLMIYQRSPQWVAPFAKFRKEVPESVRWLLHRVPLYRYWYRAGLHWVFNDRLHSALQKDPEWPHPERAVNRKNDRHREFFTKYIISELGDRQELLPKVLPDYPPFGKRMLLDNGWYQMLLRENVELVNGAAKKILPHGIADEQGTERSADTIIFATGFDVTNFLSTIEVIGRDGQRLADTWASGNAKAYLGSSVPSFPNLFILYGPNTQTGHGGSLIWTLEAQLQYIGRLLEKMIADDVVTIECREEVYEAYNERVDEAHEGMIWTHPGMSTYYRNDAGRVVVPSPFRNIDYWHMAQTSDLDDYIVEHRSTPGKAHKEVRAAKA